MKKSNEITAIPKLLDSLGLEGTTVTIDAMGCQKRSLKKIINGGGDYVLGAKDNHPQLCKAIEDHFEEAHLADFEDCEVRRHTTTEKGHGRVETRHYSQCVVPASMAKQAAGWAKLKTICQVVNITERDGRKRAMCDTTSAAYAGRQATC